MVDSLLFPPPERLARRDSFVDRRFVHCNGANGCVTHWLVMDHRHLIAYVFMLLIAGLLGVGWWRMSVHWRGRRRASREFDRQQRERRSDDERG
jgi:hypothetical protein